MLWNKVQSAEIFWSIWIWRLRRQVFACEVCSALTRDPFLLIAIKKKKMVWVSFRFSSLSPNTYVPIPKMLWLETSEIKRVLKSNDYLCCMMVRLYIYWVALKCSFVDITGSQKSLISVFSYSHPLVFGVQKISSRTSWG